MYETGPSQFTMLVGMMTQCESAWSRPLADGPEIQSVLMASAIACAAKPKTMRLAEQHREPARAAERERDREHAEEVEEDARVARVAQQLEHAR